jgi:hypothetical protein
VNAEGKFVDIRPLATKVEDANLRVGYTTVESRLGIWLKTSQSGSVKNGRPFLGCRDKHEKRL